MSDSAFWQFSLRFYALPGVGEACIELQDRCGVDVNVLLFFLFLAHQGRAIDMDEAARIDAGLQAWREGVVMPLRSVRRTLRVPIAPVDRDVADALRADVKHIELEAERVEQETLEKMHPVSSTGVPATARKAAARANLAAYGARLDGLPDDLLAQVLKAFDAAEPVIFSPDCT